jgi:hypothetical protein
MFAGARRNLLDVTGVTGPLRASVMKNLLRTFDITPITQDHVSSLLNVSYPDSGVAFPRALILTEFVGSTTTTD